MQKGIIKNVNRLTGEPVDAQDLASIFTGIVGNESGVLTVFDELRLEKISDNKVRLHSGVYSLKGHMLYIPKGSYEDFEIESGTLGANRIDLLVAEYVKNGEGEGEDTLQFRVIKGETTSGTAEMPTLTQQDINASGILRQEQLYILRLSGVNLNTTFSNTKIKSNHILQKEINDLEATTKEELEKVRKSTRRTRIWNKNTDGEIERGQTVTLSEPITNFSQLVIYTSKGGIYAMTAPVTQDYNDVVFTGGYANESGTTMATFVALGRYNWENPRNFGYLGGSKTEFTNNTSLNKPRDLGNITFIYGIY